MGLGELNPESIEVFVSFLIGKFVTWLELGSPFFGVEVDNGVKGVLFESDLSSKSSILYEERFSSDLGTFAGAWTTGSGDLGRFAAR